MERLSITLGEARNDRIEDRLGYGDKKSQWIREAIDLRLDLENESEMIEDNYGAIEA